MDSLTDLIPVSRAEFAAEIVPCLSLASGVSMSEADQRVWLNAAYKALDGIPIKLLKRGCAAAMMKADHPSKIVPTIMADIGADWEWRKQAVRPNAMETAAAAQALPEPGGERPNAAEIDAICKRFSVGRYAKASARAPSPHMPVAQAALDPDRECRKPTREDYIRLFGIDPEAPKSAPDAEAA
jgi:hypothetical protein